MQPKTSNLLSTLYVCYWLRYWSTRKAQNGNPSLLRQQYSHQDAYPAGDGQDHEQNAQLPTAHGGRAGLAHSAVEKPHVASAPLRAGWFGFDVRFPSHRQVVGPSNPNDSSIRTAQHHTNEIETQRTREKVQGRKEQMSGGK